MSRLPVVILGLLLLLLAGFGVWTWWFLPAAYVDTVKHVASTRPVEQAAETTPFVNEAVPVVADLSPRTGSDWPGFLGPNHNGRTPDAPPPVGKTSSPRISWTCEMGEGYAAPVVCLGRVIVFDRASNRIRCRCLHSDTGKELWQFSYPTEYRDKQGYDGGPRASPVTDGARVSLYGPEGMLHCLRLLDGKLLWKCDTVATFGVVQNIFGVGSTPLLDGSNLLVQVGGSPAGSSDKDFMILKSSGSCMVAFDQATGLVKYQCGQDLASYASPQVVEVNGQRVGLIFARNGIVGFDPKTGAERFHYPYRARSYNAVNASNLVAEGDTLFVTESYEPGCVQWKLMDNKLEKLWSATPRDKKQGVCCHWTTPVLVEGHLYGCTSRHRNDAELRCVDWSTGKVKWTAKPTYQGEIAGRGTLLYSANGCFYYWVEEGWLFVIRANAGKYEELAVWNVCSLATSLKQPCWTGPVLARGQLYLRGKGAMVCVDLDKQE